MKLKKLLISTCAVLWMQPVAASTERIVTADGSLTEIIYALQAEDTLVGVDTTSNYPESATQLPQIGYKRAISVEGVLSLNPDLLLITEESGPPKSINQLRQTGLKIKQFSAKPTIEAVQAKITGIAELLGKADKGEILWNDVQSRIEAAKAKTKQVKQPVRVLFVLGMNEKSPIVAGHNTHAESMIKLAGGINAIEGLEGYKPITPEAVAVANPDIILMMARKEHSIPADKLFSQPGFMLTKAAKAQGLISMEGMYLLGFGPRIGDAIHELSEKFYPQLKTAQQ
ncbi:heme/hemin ABC transporter substrate-binding protein [Neptuniibacter caesariensis]|uniref:Hemin-binding periplasmic protein n=1 Tax=Neptuniibacter caesariensis TaxID=207954 RepID=A0A7U8GPZ5_NEPCE|nr:helical backbone metal receptor [Neptuniibacter caesariensis]EAR59817.1 hemin-binding periplasmic protein [Neptuniibacter caesariensis]